MSKRVFRLVHAEARRRCANYAQNEAPDGDVVTFAPETKNRAQENKYHAQIEDLAKQTTYIGRKWHREDMKRILVDEFADEMRAAGSPLHNDGRLIPSQNGLRVIQLGVQTRDFYVKEASAFIEFLYAWGAARDVKWSEKARRSSCDVALEDEAVS